MDQINLHSLLMEMQHSRRTSASTCDRHSKLWLSEMFHNTGLPFSVTEKPKTERLPIAAYQISLCIGKIDIYDDQTIKRAFNLANAARKDRHQDKRDKWIDLDFFADECRRLTAQRTTNDVDHTQPWHQRAITAKEISQHVTPKHPMFDQALREGWEDDLRGLLEQFADFQGLKEEQLLNVKPRPEMVQMWRQMRWARAARRAGYTVGSPGPWGYGMIDISGPDSSEKIWERPVEVLGWLKEVPKHKMREHRKMTQAEAQKIRFDSKVESRLADLGLTGHAKTMP